MRDCGGGGKSHPSPTTAPSAIIPPTPPPAEPNIRESTPLLSADRALVVVTLLTLAIRLAWVAVMPVNKDEGYHYLYAVHPSWSYFDHPPMMMLVVRAGLELCGGAVNFFSLRLGFVLLSAASSWLLGRWTARRFGEWSGVYAAVWWNLAPFYSLGAGGQAMPDGPFLFFALLTMIALTHAVIDAPGRIIPWLWVGLAWAAALLSKYHAVFLPAGAVLYVILTPTARRMLLTPGPYLAVLIGVVGFSPVLYWNATHDWASFVFQGGRALGTEFRPQEIGIMLLGQMGFLTPGLWIALVVVFVSTIRRRRTIGRDERLLICLAVVPLTFFLSVSCVRKVHPHWTLLGFLPLMPLLGKRCAEWYRRWPRAMRVMTAGWAVSFVAVAFLYAAHARYGLVTFDKDPAIEQGGWESLAERLDALGVVGQPNAFLFTGTWHESGQIAFATANRSPVLCYSTYDARGFAYWSRPEDWIGQDGILISFDNCPWEPQDFSIFFTRIEFLDEFWMTRNGQPLRPVRVFRCTQQLKPFPFANLPPAK